MMGLPKLWPDIPSRLFGKFLRCIFSVMIPLAIIIEDVILGVILHNVIVTILVAKFAFERIPAVKGVKIHFGINDHFVQVVDVVTRAYGHNRRKTRPVNFTHWSQHKKGIPISTNVDGVREAYPNHRFKRHGIFSQKNHFSVTLTCASKSGKVSVQAAHRSVGIGVLFDRRRSKAALFSAAFSMVGRSGPRKRAVPSSGNANPVRPATSDWRHCGRVLEPTRRRAAQ